MRGVPATWVPCTQCSSLKAFPRTRKCRKCSARTQFVFTREMDEQVRSVWVKANGCRTVLSPAKKELAAKLKVTIATLNLRAHKLGVTRDTRKPWGKGDDMQLTAMAGLYTPRVIARKMSRTLSSVANRLGLLKVSRELVTGYTRESLQRLFGVDYPAVQSWVQRGWLPLGFDGRVSHAHVERFIFDRMDVIDLRRVNQEWFREILGTMLRRSSGERQALHHGNGAKEAMDHSAGRSLAC